MTDVGLHERAILTASRCERLALRILEEATKIERAEQRLRIINIVVGAVVALVTISSPIAKFVGASATQTLSAIGAVVLVLDGVIPYFRRRPSPDRLHDYVFFIHGYSGSIKNTLATAGSTKRNAMPA